MNWCYHERELERRKLLFALDSNAVWPEDKPRRGDYLYGEAYPEGIEEAVHRFVARAPSEVFLSQLEDILHVEKCRMSPALIVTSTPTGGANFRSDWKIWKAILPMSAISPP